MSDQPFKQFLDRELHSRDAKEHYRAQIDLLKDVVNFGSNLIHSCFTSSKRTLGDVVVIAVILKQLVMMLDAYQVLIAEACTEAAKLQCRALFEASIYIDWILLSDKERKALYYYAANVRKELLWVRRAIPVDTEQDNFFKNLGEFGRTLEKTREKLATIAPSRLKQLEEFLSKEPFVSISADFDKAKGKRPYDPPWHVPLGEKSIRSLSKAVGRLHEYEVFYMQLSETMHGARHTSHVKIKKGHITIEPMRHLERLSTSLNFTLSIIFHTYRKIIEYYCPTQSTEFSKKYRKDWQDAFMNIPRIKYQEASDEVAI